MRRRGAGLSWRQPHTGSGGSRSRRRLLRYVGRGHGCDARHGFARGSQGVLELVVLAEGCLGFGQLLRTPLPRIRVNKECKGLQRISLNAQSEAVAVAVAVAKPAKTGFSTVTVRAAGKGEAASSR